MQAFAPSVFQFGQYCVIIFSHPVGVCDTAIRAQASTVAPTSASFAIVELRRILKFKLQNRTELFSND